MDLLVNYFGTDQKQPGDSTGPKVRDSYLIHYIIEGKGSFQVGNKTYSLEKNQGFLICPGQLSYYVADPIEPWQYCFVSFDGLNAEYYISQAGLSQENPIFQYNRDHELENIISEMIQVSRENKPSRETRLLALLYTFLFNLIDTVPEREMSGHRNSDYKKNYIDRAVHYIRTNYSRKLLISEIASYVGLDISYLGLIFKKYIKVTPQQFLTNYRMEKACQFMADPKLSIGDIARSVGYEDPLLFSKTFRKEKRLSPSQYRANIYRVCSKNI